jgi:hypothetical protein
MVVLFLLIAGPGRWSLDILLARREKKESRHALPNAATI